MKILRGLKFLVLMVLIGAALSWAVMALWNRLLPGLFGWHLLTYGQAVGLLILCRILFGGRGGPRGGGGFWKRHWAERLAQMTPEEREKFREGMRRGWGGPMSAPEVQPKV
jgi:hypothetical protein